MAAHEPNPAREARTGAITLALALGTASLLAVLSRVSWQQPHEYRVGFRVNQDATGVQPGTPITLGGLQWGKVTRVEHGEVPATGDRAKAAEAARRGVTRGTLVTFDLDPRIRLMPGARIARTASFLGGGVELVITDTGLTRGSMDLLPLQGRDALSDQTVLSAASPPDGMVTLLGPRTWARTQSIPTAFTALRTQVMADATGVDPDGKPTGAVAWDARIRSIRASWDSLVALLGDGTPTHPTLGDDLGAFKTRLRPAWNEASTSIDELSTRTKAAWDERGARLWEQAKGEWKRLQSAWDAVKRAGNDSIDSYRDFMANSSLMGGQIRLTFDEPVETIFKLLFGRPGEDGMTRMRRYEAASRVAVATATLRDANDALEWLANATKPVDPAVAAELRAQAAKAAQQFAEAIERLTQLVQRP